MAAALAYPSALFLSELGEALPCPVCNGTGRDALDPNLNCAECGGSGEDR